MQWEASRRFSRGRLALLGATSSSLDHVLVVWGGFGHWGIGEGSTVAHRKHRLLAEDKHCPALGCGKGFSFAVHSAIRRKQPRQGPWPILGWPSLEEKQWDSKRIGKWGVSSGHFFVPLMMHFDKV